MFRSLIDRFTKLKRPPRLTVIERAIVEAIAWRLPSPVRQILELQIDAIYKIQRLPDGVEVNFYMRSDYDRKREAPPTFNGPNDFILATAVVALPVFAATLDAEIRCVAGHLFSIEYKGSVRYFDEAIGMDSSPKLEISARLTDEGAAMIGE
jgi:hypothetical protein